MKLKIKRVTLLILIIVVCATIFSFSSQNSNKSKESSGSIINIIIDLNPETKKLNNYEKNELKENLTTPIRKIAHFTIYTILGALVMMLITTYDIKTLKQVILSLTLGIFYACTDEFHQMFVSGRSGEFRDVLIDTSGVILGIIIVLIVIKIEKNKRT